MAAPPENVHFVRQTQQSSELVWDMPVQLQGESPSALVLEKGGAIFQLWAVSPSPPKDYLLDQKLVDVYELPKAEVAIVTLDPYSKIPRTRVDQPFRVEVQVSVQQNGNNLPIAATTVLMERKVASYPAGQFVLTPAQVASTPAIGPVVELSGNGLHPVDHPVSALTAPDPTKASGEEHFLIHAHPESNVEEPLIASAMVQVWPVASGQIKGIANGDQIRFQSPEIELLLNDLYPRSDTYLLLFEGRQYNGVNGTIVKAYPHDRETTSSQVIRVSELESKLTNDGDYTLVLVSDTVYGREMLCAPVTFNIRRTIQVNAMQVVGP